MYNLSTSFFGCNASYIVIVFLDFLSRSFYSFSFHCSILTPYLNTATAQAFIAAILLFPFSFYFRTNRSLCFYIYLLFFLSFHFLSFDSLFDLFHQLTFRELYFFTSNYFLSLHGKKSKFFLSKLHPTISIKYMNSSL